jgi:hypothetical protein
MAVEHLAAALDEPAGGPAPETIVLPMVLRVRESTGPAPAQGGDPTS